MGIKNLNSNNDKKKLIISILKILLLVVIVIGIPLYAYFFEHDWFMHFKNFDDAVSYLGKYKAQSMPIYIILQALQIIISVIPGQIFQLAAGYVYTFLPALILSVTGAFIGTVISFFLARWLGSDFVHLFFGEKKTSEYVEKLNSKKAYVAVFLIYLIPGLPKDILSYAAGISEMKFRPFILLSLVGRLPGMMGSIMLGSMWHKHEYTGMIILGIVAIAMFITFFIFRKHLSEYVDKIYDRINK